MKRLVNRSFDLLIGPDGTGRCVYGETLDLSAVDLSALGQAEIQRGSFVEPDASARWWADLSPVAGPKLGPYARRSEALDAERAWLERHWVTQTIRTASADPRAGPEIRPPARVYPAIPLHGGVYRCVQSRSQPSSCFSCSSSSGASTAAVRCGRGHNNPRPLILSKRITPMPKFLRVLAPIRPLIHLIRLSISLAAKLVPTMRLVMVIGLVVLPPLWIVRSTWTSRPAVVVAGPSIQQVQQLASLMTLRVEVADVQETHIAGYTGGVKAILVVKGDLLLGVDLARAKLQSVDMAARTAVLVLPSPSVSSARVDHERTRIFVVSETGLWQLVPGDAAQTAAFNRAYREAQKSVAKVGQDQSLHENCRRHSESVLAGFYSALGWTVTVQWEVL